jgi:hypothetical protein
MKFQQFKTTLTPFHNKIKSLVLFALIINGLAIGRVPVKEYREYHSGKLDLAEKLHKRYQPLLAHIGKEKSLGMTIKLNKKNQGRFSLLRYMVAPRNLVKLPNPKVFFSEKQNRNLKGDSTKLPKLVIYDGTLKLESLKKYVVLKEISKTLFILKKI